MSENLIEIIFVIAIILASVGFIQSLREDKNYGGRIMGNGYKQDKLSRLAEICLRMANVIDRNGENRDFKFANEVGLGYLALSGYLRDGVKAIADMQMNYSDAVSQKNLAELSESGAREYLKDIFGDEDIDDLNDKYKARIKEFVQSLFAEMEEDE